MPPMLHIQYSKMDRFDMRKVLSRKYPTDSKEPVSKRTSLECVESLLGTLQAYICCINFRLQSINSRFCLLDHQLLLNLHLSHFFKVGSCTLLCILLGCQFLLRCKHRSLMFSYSWSLSC